jgi:hypothetical protein
MKMFSDLRLLKALTQLVTPIKSNPRMDEGHQIDFIERIETPDLHLHIRPFSEGDPCTLLRNISTLSGVVNGMRYWVLDAQERVAVIRFESGKELPRSRIAMEKVSNGMTFSRRQVLLKLTYAGTVHRSHRITLNRAVIDFKSQFWEHGNFTSLCRE